MLMSVFIACQAMVSSQVFRKLHQCDGGDQLLVVHDCSAKSLVSTPGRVASQRNVTNYSPGLKTASQAFFFTLQNRCWQRLRIKVNFPEMGSACRHLVDNKRYIWGSFSG